jgi:hypothetical protein
VTPRESRCFGQSTSKAREVVLVWKPIGKQSLGRTEINNKIITNPRKAECELQMARTSPLLFALMEFSNTSVELLM